MNLVILEADQRLSDTRYCLRPRQHDHVLKTLKLGVGDQLAVGELNGNVGEGLIVDQRQDTTTIEIVHLNKPSPAALPVCLILGLPRPRMLQRILQTVATMGVLKIKLIQTSRVEKSFWQTPLLAPSSVRENLILGLEQAKATQLPEIEFHRRFIPFIEDELPAQAQSYARRFIAHPGPYPQANPDTEQPAMLAVGPEGGFLRKECDAFAALNFQPVQLGERILRVETAIPVLLAKWL